MKKSILYVFMFLPCTLLGQNISLGDDMSVGMVHAVGSIIKSQVQENDGRFIVVNNDTIREKTNQEDFLAAILYQAVARNTVTEIAGIPFGSSYEDAAVALERKFGKAFYSTRNEILYKNISYGGERFDNVLFCFQYDKHRSYLNGAVFALEVQNRNKALLSKKRFHQLLAERYPSAFLIDEELTAGGLPPIPYSKAVSWNDIQEGQTSSEMGFGFEINVVAQDKYDYPYFVRIKYGPYEYVKESF